MHISSMRHRCQKHTPNGTTSETPTCPSRSFCNIQRRCAAAQDVRNNPHVSNADSSNGTSSGALPSPPPTTEREPQPIRVSSASRAVAAIARDDEQGDSGVVAATTRGGGAGGIPLHVPTRISFEFVTDSTDPSTSSQSETKTATVIAHKCGNKICETRVAMPLVAWSLTFSLPSPQQATTPRKPSGSGA